MNANTIGMLIIMIIYLGAMVLIGILFSRKNNDTSDFYLGGRKLGPIVTAMSAEASDMSSWLLMGLPGVAYLSGCAEAGWTAIGLAIGTYLNWLIVAKRLRRYSHKANNSITIPSFFANRYRDKSNSLLAISAIMIVIFFVPYTASGFAACGKLFATLFGVPYMPAMIVSAIIIVAYTSLGGFLAASTTDLRRTYGWWHGCCYHKCTVTERLLKHDNVSRCSNRRKHTVQRTDHRLHSGMGTGLFWNAAYPAAFHGY